MNKDNQCEGYSDIPYTPMRTGAATYFVKERCTSEKMKGSKFCFCHSMQDKYEKERQEKFSNLLGDALKKSNQRNSKNEKST